ncbi:MAG: hypothetical protein EOP49_30750 [Sphingobacteriales bacterium]|nr:MAG: hypothetical protein EOP49_30750 [Sphingobacteriales bacterium]
MNIIAAVAATTLMTAFVSIIKVITRQQLNVIRVLGTMLTGSTTRDGGCSRRLGALALGTIVHYGVGLFFLFIYVYLWNHNVINTDWLTTTILGFVTGLLGITVWRIYLYIHARPPQVPLRLYLISILFAHVIFAWTVRWILH